MSSLKNPLIRILSNFKWVRITKPPKWVRWKSDGYYDYFSKKYKQRPYNVVTYFKGSNFVYKVYYKTIGQGQIEEVYYAKKR